MKHKCRILQFLTVLLIATPVCAQGSKHPPIGKVASKDRSVWLKIIKWPADCEEAFQRTYGERGAHDFGGLEFHRLNKDQYLVEIACYPGAYQPGSIFAWYDPRTSSAKLLKFKGRESEDDQGKELSYSEIDGFTTYRSKARVLMILSKYRGPGDCGFYGLYKFVRGQPVLIEAREQDCDDSHPRRNSDPTRWPKKRL
jgi:hypothetical protein